MARPMVLKPWILEAILDFHSPDATDTLMTITPQMFEEATGRPPENDDIERVNCPDAGSDGHLGCGWHVERNAPMYAVPVTRR